VAAVHCWHLLDVERAASAGRQDPLLNPTLLTIGALCAALIGFQIPYAAYFDSVNVLHYLLGTAVVALAIPLHRNLQKLMCDLRPIALALIAGSLTSTLCGLALAKALGASSAVLLSIAPKSATAAVSMEIARGIGGFPAVAACLTIFTGIIGAVLGPYILTWAGVVSPTARGVALGTASRGTGFQRVRAGGMLRKSGHEPQRDPYGLLVPAVISAMRLIGL